MDKNQKFNFSALLAVLSPFVVLIIIPWGTSEFSWVSKLLLLFGVFVSLFIWRNQLSTWIIHTERGAREHISSSSKYQTELSQIYGTWVDKVIRATGSLNKKAAPAIYFIDPEASSFTLQSKAAPVFRNSIPLNNKLAQRILSQKESSVFQEKDVRDEWKEFFNENTWRGSEVIITSGIEFKGKVNGFLVLWVEHFNQVEPNIKNVIKTLSSLFSEGLDRIDQNEKLINELLVQEKIINYVLNVKIHDPLDVTMNNFINLARSFFTYDQLTITVLDRELNKPLIVGLDGPEATVSPGVRLDNNDAFHTWIYKNKDIINIGDLKNEFSGSRYGIDMTKELSTSSALAVPVKDDGRIIGMLVLERVTARPFTERDISYTSVISSILATIIPDYNTFRQVQINATQDALTGLLNRRVFDERIKDELARAKRFNQFVTLVIFDLDKFKRINDNHGHVYGDYVIKTTAQIIKSSIRNIDIAARYGGEEFVLILVNTDKNHSNIVVERIVKSIEEYEFSRDDIKVKMTISAGLADYPEDATETTHLIECADLALYKTKEKGGNGMTAFDPSFSQ